MMGKGSHYDDAIEEVMSYAVLKLDGRGIRASVRNPEEMRGVLQWMNDREREQGKHPRFSDSFIDEAVSSRRAREVYQGREIRAENMQLNYGVPARAVIVKQGVLGRFGGTIKRFLMGKMQSAKDRDGDLRTFIMPAPSQKQPNAPTPVVEVRDYREQEIIYHSGRHAIVARDALGRFTKRRSA